jgi:DNA-binding response OmpR family regulator
MPVDRDPAIQSEWGKPNSTSANSANSASGDATCPAPPGTACNDAAAIPGLVARSGLGTGFAGVTLVDQRQSVLQVDADSCSSSARSAVLRQHGFSVEHVRDAASALQRAATPIYDLAIVHRSLPGEVSGLELGEHLRALRPGLGIVMLGSSWGPFERCQALEAFADDCLVDTGETTELLARLKALGRRSKLIATHSCSVGWGPFRVDLVGGFVEMNGHEVPLQPLQLRLLGYLIDRAGRVVTHEELQRVVFRAIQLAGSSISRQVSLLRKQLGPTGSMIVTVRGGYGLGLTRNLPSTNAAPRVFHASSALHPTKR